MNLVWIVALAAAAHGTGTTAADYYRRSFHASTPQKRVELLDKALAINPNHVPALRYRSTLYSILGKKRLALADSARAADLSPRDPSTNRAAGILADELKEYAKAARFYGRALAFDRADVALRSRRIRVLIKLLKTGEALEDANFLVERHPHQDFAYSVRADVYEWCDKYADAARDMTVLIKRDPKEARYYLRRCINYRGAGEGEKALADAEKAIQLKGDTAYGCAARGCSYELLGRLDKALADYKRAADLDDDRRFYVIWSCLILRKQGKREEAEKLARDFVKELKDDKWVAPVLKYLAGQMTEEEVFRRARHKDPEKNREQHCEGYYYVGACYLADGKLDKAQELFTKCLAQRVHNFYEHGFAIRDLRTIRKLRAEAGAKMSDGKNVKGNGDRGGEK